MADKNLKKKLNNDITSKEEIPKIETSLFMYSIKVI